MAYHLDDLRFAAFPDETSVAAAMTGAGLPREHLEEAIRTFVCPAPLVDGFGYQQSIADSLQAHLRTRLAVAPLQAVSTRISPSLNEKADLALGLSATSTAVYIEIEFRPNVEKDLIKFQISRNRGRLAAAVLLVAINRGRINASYSTMPEFEKVERLLSELEVSYPLLLVGIGGEHRT